MKDRPLSRDELASVIEGKGAAYRVPILVHLWVHTNTFGDRQLEVLDLLSQYPMDAQIIPVKIPQIFDAPEDDLNYRWSDSDKPDDYEERGLDERIVINDWERLDSILKNFPDPYYKGMFENAAASDGRYRLGKWFYCLFERHWSLRGMTNALMDFYINPEEVHRLYQALTDFYLILMERGKREANLDGILTSDDIGTQKAPFFSLEIFREFFKPYYKQIIDKAHALGMHFWLHTCGNIEPFISDFIEIGLDVIHPIQKYTMNEKVISEKYGKDICIWAGFDVQQIIPWGTPEEIRQEVRALIDTYYRKDGRFMLTAGNGVNADCPTESLKTLFEETLIYGTGVCQNRR